MSPRKDVPRTAATLTGFALVIAAATVAISSSNEAPAAAATAAPLIAAAPLISVAATATPSVAPATERPAEISRSSARTAPRRAPRTTASTKTVTAPKSADRVVRIAGVATSADMQRKLDACNGPIQINWSTHTTEIAQHDYCGGSWMSKVSTGQRITVVGGTISGTYVVNGNRRTVSKDSSASALDGLGSLVLQTCVGSRMVLVGLSPA